MKKIVCDTNILISAFVFPGGPPEEIFRGVITQDYQLGISESILEEFKKVLIKKFFWPEERTNEIIELIKRNSVTVTPKLELKVIHDEPDNRILECAIEFKADCIISGDKHILKLRKYKKIRILDASVFLKEIF
ncbi:MAG: putative toxin-antitoxin system toxin component, PIN family [Elusimicrobia bacterium CG1_02_37_114]|nr:MAG: putative toxin-antitoxin system toxin component, PIN family [Elusimicrobia bacterium CG1_02_37_114]PIV53796.1 MAG: putative toxin-antitoxin system toxin component, PIN family [Elusimicrobia bacterium CG02_land_8_20_14_3_00_37_13]PIZ13061.1 MAG: putative toxin-antitoxin system toxin component, PIN family [Elusimicrobia bacterium CG_4_10_14_0_8_um_filter_37_32]